MLPVDVVLSDRAIARGARRFRRRRVVHRLGCLVRLAVVVAILAVAIAYFRPHSTTPALAFTPSPERRFIWIGTTDGTQFTADQFDELAHDYHSVVIAKFHAGFDITKHQEAARELKALDPNIDVYEYFSTKYWFDANKWGADTINPDWFLRDTKGNIVYRYNTESDGTRVRVGEYVDDANPAYRAWAVKVITGWMQAAPYRGVAFDAADPIGDYNDPDINKWNSLLGASRVAAYNAGIRSLLSAVRTAIGSGHRTIFNGISPYLIRGPGRDLDLLQDADGAMDERFCLDGTGAISNVREDIDVMQQYSDSILFMKTNFGSDVNGDLKDRYSRFCLGAFLLGWQPGSSYFEFAPGYGTGQLKRQPPNQTVDVGTPTGAAVFTGDVGVRSFTKGYVVVNTGTTTATAVVPRALDDVSDGLHTKPVATGTKLTIPAGDAYLLVTPSSAPK